MDQAPLGLPREYLTKSMNDKIVKAYYDYMVDIAEILGADRADALIQLNDSLIFEMKLANVSYALIFFLLLNIVATRNKKFHDHN